MGVDECAQNVATVRSADALDRVRTLAGRTAAGRVSAAGRERIAAGVCA